MRNALIFGGGALVGVIVWRWWMSGPLGSGCGCSGGTSTVNNGQQMTAGAASNSSGGAPYVLGGIGAPALPTPGLAVIGTPSPGVPVISFSLFAKARAADTAFKPAQPAPAGLLTGPNILGGVDVPGSVSDAPG